MQILKQYSTVPKPEAEARVAAAATEAGHRATIEQLGLALARGGASASAEASGGKAVAWLRECAAASAARARFDAEAAARAGDWARAAAACRAETRATLDGEAWYLDVLRHKPLADAAFVLGAQLVEHGEFTRGWRMWALGSHAAHGGHGDLDALAAKRVAYYPDAPAPPVPENETGAKAKKKNAKKPKKFGKRDFQAYTVDASERAVALAGGARDLIFRTKRAVLSAEDCRFVVEAAEKAAAAQGGWTSKRHVAYATRDMPVDKVPALLPVVNRWFEDTLFPLLAHCYPTLVPGGASTLRVHDAFIVKYVERGRCAAAAAAAAAAAEPRATATPVAAAPYPTCCCCCCY